MTAPTQALEPAAPGATDQVLDVSGVTLRFGGLTSLNDVSLTQTRGEILSVIGPNGAGKTSLFNCLTGVYTPQEGQITFRPRDGRSLQIIGRKPFAVNRMGVARTFQNIRLFNALTAIENVKIGVESHQKTGPVSAMLGLPRARREERESDEEAFRLLEFVGLAARANELSSSLPYGDQRRLEIARAMATRPELLLLDEPAAGTNPAEKRQLEVLIRKIAETGISVLLIEHDMRLVMAVAARVVVLNFGQVIATGRPEEIQRDPKVVEAYLGGGDAAADAATGAAIQQAATERAAGGTSGIGVPRGADGPEGGGSPAKRISPAAATKSVTTSVKKAKSLTKAVPPPAKAPARSAAKAPAKSAAKAAAKSAAKAPAKSAAKAPAKAPAKSAAKAPAKAPAKAAAKAPAKAPAKSPAKAPAKSAAKAPAKRAAQATPTKKA